MSKGNKPAKNDKAKMKPKKAKETKPSGSSDLQTNRLSGVFNTMNKKAGAL